MWRQSYLFQCRHSHRQCCLVCQTIFWVNRKNVPISQCCIAFGTRRAVPPRMPGTSQAGCESCSSSCISLLPSDRSACNTAGAGGCPASVDMRLHTCPRHISALPHIMMTRADVDMLWRTDASPVRQLWRNARRRLLHIRRRAAMYCRLRRPPAGRRGCCSAAKYPRGGAARGASRLGAAHAARRRLPAAAAAALRSGGRRDCRGAGRDLPVPGRGERRQHSRWFCQAPLTPVAWSVLRGTASFAQWAERGVAVIAAARGAAAR